MGAGTVTTNIDQIDVKTPTSLRVVSLKPAGYGISRNLGDLNAKDWITKQMYFDNLPGVSIVIRQPFTTSNTSTGQFVINWQTDIPTGQTQTYATLLGNQVEPQWFLIPGGSGGGIPQGINGISWTTDSGGNVLVVTIDMGIPANGYVKFN